MLPLAAGREFEIFAGGAIPSHKHSLVCPLRSKARKAAKDAYKKAQMYLKMKQLREAREKVGKAWKNTRPSSEWR